MEADMSEVSDAASYISGTELFVDGGRTQIGARMVARERASGPFTRPDTFGVSN